MFRMSLYLPEAEISARPTIMKISYFTPLRKKIQVQEKKLFQKKRYFCLKSSENFIYFFGGDPFLSGGAGKAVRLKSQLARLLSLRCKQIYRYLNINQSQNARRQFPRNVKGKLKH